LQQLLQQVVQHVVQQVLQHGGGQQGICLVTQRQTMRQQVTVSQCGTQRTTVRQHW
jgi:hypothetical protein